MKKIFLIISLIFNGFFVFAQHNYIYRGDKQYPATNTWEFQGGHDLEVTIAKTTTGGYLMLSTYTDNYEFIGGIIYVFLMDGSVIKCTDKGIKDHLDGNSIALYVFTKEEIEKLKSSHIQKIRFSIKNKPGYFDASEVENYTAENRKKIFLWMPENSQGKIEGPNYYETAKEVTELFQ